MAVAGSWAAANTKQCHHCLQLVERSAGCNHMSCTCGNEFCYECGVNWEGYEHVCGLVRAAVEPYDYTAHIATAALAIALSDFIRNGSQAEVLVAERRFDGEDGCWYSREAFLLFYGGTTGAKRWARATATNGQPETNQRCEARVAWTLWPLPPSTARFWPIFSHF
jgi:hypothetical protein